MNKADVLDHGYVRLVGVLGGDLTVVDSARVSFDKSSQWEDYFEDTEIVLPDRDGVDQTYHWKQRKLKLKSADKRLLKYLAEHNHSSPFRHCVLSFEIYAPLMVMRQWGKYRVGSTWLFEDSDDSLETWNESSRRYITEEPEFYVPSVWRSAPENKKQGSGEPVSEELADHYDWVMQDNVHCAIDDYKRMLSEGLCAEQARLFLPAYAMYIRSRWTVSLQGVIHFLQQRLGEGSQWEIAEYAKAVLDLAKPKFPESMEVWGL